MKKSGGLWIKPLICHESKGPIVQIKYPNIILSQDRSKTVDVMNSRLYL